MSRFRIRHETTYSYEKPVTFGAWRLLIRPADTHSIRLVEASFELEPSGPTRWTYDAYGNSVCHVMPQGPATQLRVVNHLLIERYPAPLAPLSLGDPRSLTPIVYDGAAQAALAPFIAPATDESDPAYLDWLRAHASRPEEPALAYLDRLAREIRSGFAYTTRHEVGTQSPAATIALGGGACRDLAWLMIESLRRFGFAARFVTGYIYAGENGAVGAGATHAWCDVFLSDLGWIECDPTNGLLESADLIRVAQTRTPQEALPMDGVIHEAVRSTLHVNVAVDQV